MDAIYQREDLLEVYKNPQHFGHLTNYNVQQRATNPMCGDELLLELQVGSGVLTDAKFSGRACAVSTISSSLVLDDIIGKPLEEVKKIDKKYVLNLLGVTVTTSRIKCATLILDALTSALKKYEQK